MPTKSDYAEDLARAHAAGIALGKQLADARAQRDLLAEALHAILDGLEEMTTEAFQRGEDKALRRLAREALRGVSDQRH